MKKKVCLHDQIDLIAFTRKKLNLIKHLGVVFSSNLTWNLHIEEVVEKAYSRLGILQRLKYNLDRRTLQKLYFSFFRPILEYDDIIWDNMPEYLINKIESISSVGSGQNCHGR